MKKRNIIPLLFVSLAMIVSSCDKQEQTPNTNGEQEAQNYEFSVYHYHDWSYGQYDNPLRQTDIIYTDAPLTFVVKNGNADAYFIWSGEENSNFEYRDNENNSGMAMKKSLFDSVCIYTGLPHTTKVNEFTVTGWYTTPGQYTLTVVGRTMNDTTGESYRDEVVEQRPVMVVDTTCILFGDVGNANYRFMYYPYIDNSGRPSPGMSAGNITQLSGQKIQPCLNAANIDRKNNISFAIKAHRAQIFTDGRELEYDLDREWYTLKNIDLSTTAKEIVVKAQSPGYERVYTILPIVPCPE